MIYLENTTDSQVAFIPKNDTPPSDDLVFTAKSTVDLDTVVSQEVLDLETSDQYFNTAVTLPSGLPNGEYEYTLTSGEITLSSGLMILGENTSPSQYNQDITYEQYTAE